MVPFQQIESQMEQSITQGTIKTKTLQKQRNCPGWPCPKLMWHAHKGNYYECNFLRYFSKITTEATTDLQYNQPLSEIS